VGKRRLSLKLADMFGCKHSDDSTSHNQSDVLAVLSSSSGQHLLFAKSSVELSPMTSA
jgi:hypothetical protein